MQCVEQAYTQADDLWKDNCRLICGRLPYTRNMCKSVRRRFGRCWLCDNRGTRTTQTKNAEGIVTAVSTERCFLCKGTRMVSKHSCLNRVLGDGVVHALEMGWSTLADAYTKRLKALDVEAVKKALADRKRGEDLWAAAKRARIMEEREKKRKARQTLRDIKREVAALRKKRMAEARERSKVRMARKKEKQKREGKAKPMGLTKPLGVWKDKNWKEEKKRDEEKKRGDG